MAGMPACWHWENSSCSRAAPSSIEYSVCTCRWTNDFLGSAPAAVIGQASQTLATYAHRLADLVLAAQHVEGAGQVGRVAAVELGPTAVGRVGERQAHRVQPLPGDP